MQDLSNAKLVALEPIIRSPATRSNFCTSLWLPRRGRHAVELDANDADQGLLPDGEGSGDGVGDDVGSGLGEVVDSGSVVAEGSGDEEGSGAGLSEGEGLGEGLASPSVASSLSL